MTPQQNYVGKVSEPPTTDPMDYVIRQGRYFPIGGIIKIVKTEKQDYFDISCFNGFANLGSNVLRNSSMTLSASTKPPTSTSP